MTGKGSSAPLIVVSGPTASGKTALAIRLAKEVEGEIVNLDSVQLYKHFNIGSAKPGAKELEQVRHHLISILEPTERCNVARYVELAEKSVSEVSERDHRVILAGGTTMYLTCLLQGLDDLPEAESSLRQELENLTSEELLERLKKLDPASAERISANDKVRMVRALESSIISGRPSSQSRLIDREPSHKALVIVLCLKRPVLYRRINQRVLDMLEAGLIQETRRIVQEYGSDAPALRSLGYAQVLSFLRGDLPEESLLEEISKYTRRFAKRQTTYWRNEPVKRGWLSDPAQQSGQKGDLTMMQWSWRDLLSLTRQVSQQGLERTRVIYLDAEYLTASMNSNI